MTENNRKTPGSSGVNRGICLPIGIDTTTEVDSDGLPRWMHHPEHGFHHLGKRQLTFAWECLDFQFHLPEFDLWLSARPASSEKTQFLLHREKALQAFIANDEPAMVSQLQILDARQLASQVWPLARSGRKTNKANRERSRKPRRLKVMTNAITKLATRPGSGKELWPVFCRLLEDDGCIVSDTATDAGQPAVEVSYDGRVRKFSLKAFHHALGEERKKSRQPG